MKNTSMKTIFTLTAISSAFLLSGVALAGAPVPNVAQMNTVKELKALNNNVEVVGNRIQAVAEANAKARSNATPNQSILNSMLANPAVAKDKDANSDLINQSTLDDLSTQLSSLPSNLAETGGGMLDTKDIQSNIDYYKNLQYSLTALSPASDSIFSNDPAVLSMAGAYVSQGLLPPRGLAKPTGDNSHDDYFNFGSVIQPMVYQDKTDQALAAQSYLTFLTKSYEVPSAAIDYKKFQDKLSKSQNASDKLSLYTQLLNDPQYRDYQLEERSSAAARSVAINNFEKLISERTLVKGLGTDAGLVDKNGKAIPDASPLQVQSYLANRRIDNPAWYAHVQAESSANVQRETLVVLAEIEAQNFQAHLDSERLLATISAQTAMGQSMSTAMMLSKAQKVNKDIEKFKIPSQQQEKKQKDNNNK